MPVDRASVKPEESREERVREREIACGFSFTFLTIMSRARVRNVLRQIKMYLLSRNMYVIHAVSWESKGEELFENRIIGLEQLSNV